MSDVKAKYRDMYANNKTLYLHMQIITPDIFNQQTNFKGDPKLQPLKNFRNSVALVQYMAQVKEEDLKNLMAEFTSDIP